MSIERIDQRLDAAPRCWYTNAEFFADSLEKFGRRELRIEHNCDVGIARHAIEQQRPTQGGLAGSDFAGQLNESATFGHTVHKVRQRLAMALAHEQVTRIWRYREGLFIEPKKTSVHSSILTQSGPGQGPGTT